MGLLIINDVEYELYSDDKLFERECGIWFEFAIMSSGDTLFYLQCPKLLCNQQTQSIPTHLVLEPECKHSLQRIFDLCWVCVKVSVLFFVFDLGLCMMYNKCCH